MPENTPILDYTSISFTEDVQVDAKLALCVPSVQTHRAPWMSAPGDSMTAQPARIPWVEPLADLSFRNLVIALSCGSIISAGPDH